MKIPKIDIEDLDLYADFFDKLQSEGLTFKDFLLNVMQEYLNPKLKYRPHKADYLITELAIRYCELSLSSINKFNVSHETSIYSIVSSLTLDLLEVLDTPKAKQLIENFDQETAIDYITTKFYD